jgi:hypothetical protein
MAAYSVIWNSIRHSKETSWQAICLPHNYRYIILIKPPTTASKVDLGEGYGSTFSLLVHKVRRYKHRSQWLIHMNDYRRCIWAWYISLLTKKMPIPYRLLMLTIILSNQPRRVLRPIRIRGALATRILVVILRILYMQLSISYICDCNSIRIGYHLLPCISHCRLRHRTSYNRRCFPWGWDIQMSPGCSLPIQKTLRRLLTSPALYFHLVPWVGAHFAVHRPRMSSL